MQRPSKSWLVYSVLNEGRSTFPSAAVSNKPTLKLISTVRVSIN